MAKKLRVTWPFTYSCSPSANASLKGMTSTRNKRCWSHQWSQNSLGKTSQGIFSSVLRLNWWDKEEEDILSHQVHVPDVIDLKKNGWVARYQECLKTTDQIHYQDQLEKETENEMFRHIAGVPPKGRKSRNMSDSEKLSSPKEDQVSDRWRKILHVVGEIQNHTSTEHAYIFSTLFAIRIGKRHRYFMIQYCLIQHRCQPWRKNFRDSSYLLIVTQNHTHLITNYLIERMLCELWCM